jgi:RNA polymerase sigma-70 factor (sigma-E family)
VASTAQRPDSSDIDELFRIHRLALVRLALLLVDDRETAEDVVQDAFAALHRRWSQVGPPDTALPYLRTSVVNASRSVLRRRRTVRQTPPLVDVADEPADAATLLADEHREVLDALRTLPRRQREVIVLRYWSQLGEAEIAATLGISVGAVKSNASRGRDAIAAALSDTLRGQS